MVKSGALWSKVGTHPKIAMASTNHPSTRVFSGEFRHSLDGKKRVTIPSAWRCNETDEFVIVPNPSESCLAVMPPEAFERMGEEAKATRSPQEYRLFVRLFYSNSYRVSTDKQGRLLLPENYCTQAGLSGDTVLVGGMDRFEIWNVENWTKFVQGAQATYEEVARAVGL